MGTVVRIDVTGAMEDYIYCIANGETHEQALKEGLVDEFFKVVGTKSKVKGVERFIVSTEDLIFKLNLQLLAETNQKVRVGQV